MNEPTRPAPLSRDEVAQLLAIAERDLGQAGIVELHLDTRYSLAYNAALQLATVVLRLHGVRVRREGFHRSTFAELEPRLPDSVRSFADYFDRARRKRHAAGYERVGVVSEGEADDLIRQVELFQAWVIEEVDRLRDRTKAQSQDMV